MKETLSEYVKRVMRQKGFNLRDVERNCGKKLTNSHLSKIVSGVTKNLRSDKVVALALGLQVDPHEVFSVISGHPVKDQEPLDISAFADAVQKLAANPRLIEVVQEWSRLSAKDEAILLHELKFVTRGKQRPKERRKKTD